MHFEMNTLGFSDLVPALPGGPASGLNFMERLFFGRSCARTC